MDERPMAGGPQGEQAPAANRPFGHAMTRRAQEVTVPIRDLTESPPPPRAIPVQGSEPGTALPIRRDGEEVA